MPMFQTRSKTMRKTYTHFFFMICIICFMVSKSSYALTVMAKSCSLTDVQNAVISANRGDVVVVPAGECNWSNTLNITKAITLQGEGSNATKIKSTFRQNNQKTDAPFISYSGSAYDVGTAFRITGIQFDSAHYSWSQGSTTCHYATPILHATAPSAASVRVDNNRMINLYRVNNNASCVTPGGSYDFQKSRPFLFSYVRGVVDNNYFQGNISILHTRWGRSWIQSLWSGWDNGTADNLFVEDNTFIESGYSQVTVAGQGGSIVFRYNDIDYSMHGGTYFYPFDTHGHQKGPTFASFGAEVYGNRVLGNNDQSFNLAEIRGGRAKIFYNKSEIQAQAGSIKVRTLWGDDTDVNPSNSSFGVCQPGTLYAGIKVCGIDGRTQYPEKTYIWNNRQYNNILMQVSNTKGAISYNKPKLLRENREWWKDYGTWNEAISYYDTKKTGIYSDDIETTYTYTFKSAGVFDGSSGIGCGTTEERPSRCSPGVGFWATNQSCSSVQKGMYGKNPANPIQGTLYVCGSNNNWVASYTPYTYPHPLRIGEVESISAPKGFKLIN